mmetsp:Transcript_73056/g.136486  ORF Transcript_73056/g.136486 Transcript_73056/m.136486 type:complete len:531 (+) Transcript_73056:90-1682(+)
MRRGGVLDRKYVFEYDVGQWLCGTVQIVKERETGKLKTCKTVPKSMIRGNGVIDQVHKLQQLKHSHVCSVTDVCEDQSNVYILQEFCMGGDVGDWVEKLEEGRWLQEQTCAAYVRQVILALYHSHSHYVFHRDLTPSTLALTSKMPDAEVKVMDMGLAAILDPDSFIARKAQSPYLAPEILSGATQSFGGPSDMWSVGAIAHHLLVGVPPHGKRKSVASWLDKAKALAGVGGHEDGWAERSAASREFVELLLSDEPQDRPTPAQALHHPWMKSLGPTGGVQPMVGKDAAKDVREGRYKTLCYVLGVLLIPQQVPHRDFEQLRSMFARADGDHDGFSPRTTVRKLLMNRCQYDEAVDHAMDIADVGKTDVLDLCATAVADVIARDFFAAGPTSQPLAGPFRATDLAPRMIKRLIEVYAGRGQTTVTAAAIRARLRTSTSRDLEQFAGVRYEEILSSLPENVSMNSQTLSQNLQTNGGQGTPLAAGSNNEPEDTSSWIVGPFGLNMGFLFQTCHVGNGYRRDDDSPNALNAH